MEYANYSNLTQYSVDHILKFAGYESHYREHIHNWLSPSVHSYELRLGSKLMPF